MLIRPLLRVCVYAGAILVSQALVRTNAAAWLRIAAIVPIALLGTLLIDRLVPASDVDND